MLSDFNRRFEDYFFGKEAGFVKKTFGVSFSFILLSVLGFLAFIVLQVVGSLISFLLGTSSTPYPDYRDHQESTNSNEAEYYGSPCTGRNDTDC